MEKGDMMIQKFIFYKILFIISLIFYYFWYIIAYHFLCISLPCICVFILSFLIGRSYIFIYESILGLEGDNNTGVGARMKNRKINIGTS